MPRTSKTVVPLKVADRILRSMGRFTGHRVSDGAAEELAKILEDIGVEIANSTFTAMQHAGRSTMQREDVRFAFEMSFSTTARFIERMKKGRNVND